MKIRLVLLEEPLEGRVPLPDLFAGLDREGHEVLFLKPERDHDVGDRIPHPVDRDQVDRVQPGEVERPVVIAHVEIRLGAVVQIADVVDRDLIALDGGIGQSGHVPLPGPVVRGRDAHPPGHHPGEHEQEPDQGPAPVGQAEKRQRRGQAEARGHDRLQQARGRLGPVDGAHAPGGHQDDDGNKKQQADHFREFLHGAVLGSFKSRTGSRVRASSDSRTGSAAPPRWSGRSPGSSGPSAR